MTNRRFELWRILLVLAVIVLTIWLAPLYARGSMRLATWNVWDWRTDAGGSIRYGPRPISRFWHVAFRRTPGTRTSPTTRRYGRTW